MGNTCNCQGHSTTCPDHTIAICIDIDGICQNECLYIPGRFGRPNDAFASWARNTIIEHAYQVISRDSTVYFNRMEFDKQFTRNAFEFVRNGSQTIYFNNQLTVKIHFSINF